MLPRCTSVRSLRPAVPARQTSMQRVSILCRCQGSQGHILLGPSWQMTAKYIPCSSFELSFRRVVSRAVRSPSKPRTECFAGSGDHRREGAFRRGVTASVAGGPPLTPAVVGVLSYLQAAVLSEPPEKRLFSYRVVWMIRRSTWSRGRIDKGLHVERSCRLVPGASD